MCSSHSTCPIPSPSTTDLEAKREQDNYKLDEETRQNNQPTNQPTPPPKKIFLFFSNSAHKHSKIYLTYYKLFALSAMLSPVTDIVF